nr:type II toxin-antitoxin system HicB family antitoxin [uncultured Dongia sp.]
MADYIAVLMPDGRKGYTVLFPDLPCCATQGVDIVTATAAAGRTLADHLAAMQDAQQSLPEPSTLEMIRADSAWAAEYNVDWSRALVTHVAEPDTPDLIPVRNSRPIAKE